MVNRRQILILNFLILNCLSLSQGHLNVKKINLFFIKFQKKKAFKYLNTEFDLSNLNKKFKYLKIIYWISFYFFKEYHQKAGLLEKEEMLGKEFHNQNSVI